MLDSIYITILNSISTFFQTYNNISLLPETNISIIKILLLTHLRFSKKSALIFQNPIYQIGIG